jgi:CobQ-like glutamine amidotransferase family enzyme
MSQDKRINVLHLYPREMNIYGDWGNVLTLLRRLEWHGYEPQLLQYGPGETFPSNADIIVGGGGQDSGQTKVQDDLLRIGNDLHKLADNDVPMLMICGLYQLFGRFFKTQNDEIIHGIAMFDAETHAGPTRLIGNTIIDSQLGQLIGYENHSGQTYIDDPSQALGKVIKGAGNNGQDGTEGCMYRNVYGTYLHGSLLPKNPQLADAFIERAVKRKFGSFTPGTINDSFVEKARAVAAKRPR